MLFKSDRNEIPKIGTYGLIMTIPLGFLSKVSVVPIIHRYVSILELRYLADIPKRVDFGPETISYIPGGCM